MLLPGDGIAMTGYFGQHAERLAGYGYDVIPISLPTDGGNSPGKRPAQRQGWQNGCPSEHWPAFARYGVGILTRSTPALDIDVKDRGLAEKIQDLADRHLGDAPYRIGLAPKRLMPYRLAGDHFDKIRLTWHGLGDELHESNIPPAVEILSNGQQFVALGVHPGTGRPYHWHRDPDLEIPRDLLPALDQAKAERFMRALASTLERHGATDVKLSGIAKPAEAAPLGRPAPTGGAHPAAEFQAKLNFNKDVASCATDVERIGDALGRHPAPDDYHQWVRTGLALKAALPGSEGERLWHWYSSRSTKYNQKEAARKWKSFKPGRITAGTIFWDAAR